jgi:hypothetical protein
MKYTVRITILVCIAAATFAISPSALAVGRSRFGSPSPSPSPGAKASASPAAKAERAIPFHGMISAVDKKSKTFTIAGKGESRVFKITNQTVLTKAGNPATIKDLTEKEEVRGSYWKKSDGTLEAKNVKLGPLTEQEKAAEEARKAKRTEKKAATETSASPGASASP